jgi:hypothetical protein
MPKPLVTDELWTVVEPPVPKQPPNPKGGRPRVNDRAALKGILFVLNIATLFSPKGERIFASSGFTPLLCSLPA